MAHADELAEQRFDAADALANTPGLRAMVIQPTCARQGKSARRASVALSEGSVELREAYGDANPLLGRSFVEIANKKLQLSDLDGALGALGGRPATSTQGRLAIPTRR